MVLDEPKKNDKHYQVEGLSWIISEKDDSYIMGGGGIRIDHVKSWLGAGFQLSLKSRFQGGGCC